MATDEKWRPMTPQSTQLPPVQKVMASQTEIPQLDERLWRAWVEKNKQRDKVKFARRVKVIAILIVLALAVLVQRMVS